MVSKEFAALVREVVRSKEFKRMKGYRHHVRGNVYDHSLKVAYLCYRHHKRFGMKTDAAELVKGALLHDYYLYDRSDKSALHRFHWFKHPERALENAQKKYPDLTCVQKDMIKHHMFPLTLSPPRTAAGWVICFYDKVAAIDDRFGWGRKKKKRDFFAL